MSLLPREVPAMEHSPPADGDDDSSSSTSSERSTEHPTVATLDDVYTATEELQRQEDERHRTEERQLQAQEEEMRLRREALRSRVVSVRQQLHSTREHTEEREEITARVTSLRVQREEPFEEKTVLRINRTRAVLPWSTRIWHSLYNTVRYFLVSLSYTPGINPDEANAPREYYQHEGFD